MRGYSHCLGDRLLLMPPGSTQSSPFPPLGSTSPGLPASATTKKSGTLESDALLLLFWLFGCLVVWLLVVWLFGCLVVWLFGCLVVVVVVVVGLLFGGGGCCGCCGCSRRLMTHEQGPQNQDDYAAASFQHHHLLQPMKPQASISSKPVDENDPQKIPQKPHERRFFSWVEISYTQNQKPQTDLRSFHNQDWKDQNAPTHHQQAKATPP